MSGVNPWLGDGPATFDVGPNTVVGGQLVEADSANAGKVKAASAGSSTVLGVALTDARPNNTSTDPLYIEDPGTSVAVAHDVDIRVTYAAAATLGALLKSAANGQVTPLVVGTDDMSLAVGRCTQPASGSGVVARARIF